jgi:geranylgeranyl diphosphate/geranylgeranyl-bacteriochlorophyllide a reductase
MKTTFDAVVVGGGPAGSWAARSLALKGARVLLADPSHPREKACGGGVTGRALDLVSTAVDARQIPSVSIRSARFTSSSSRADCAVPLERGALVVASRIEFDALLLEAAQRAGAHFLPSRVTAVRPVDRAFEVETAAGCYRATHLIGADGANSLVRRRLARPFRRDQLSIATGFFAHGATSDEILVEFVGNPPGYIWSFPRRDHLAIGICAQADAGASAGDLRRIAADWIRKGGIANSARLQTYSWPIPSLASSDLERLQPAGRGWFLVGDAAGLVDPITREGIYFALRSAEWAADAIASAAGEPWGAYGLQVREECGMELARAARIKRRFFQPEFTHFLLDALEHSASVRTIMADLVAGEQPYSSLKWRLLKTFRVGLAFRFFAAEARRRAARPSEP